MEMKFLQGVNSPEYGGQLSRNMQFVEVVHMVLTKASISQSRLCRGLGVQ